MVRMTSIGSVCYRQRGRDVVIESMTSIDEERQAVNEPDDSLLTVDEVAELLTVSKSTISRLRERGEFASPFKIGNVHRWRKSAVLAWLETTQEQTK